MYRKCNSGYDFVFSHKINGLITAFGGPNSHMSIRCNEFGIPAAIGIGDKKFQQLINNDTLFLDCKKSDYSFMTIIFKIILKF